MPFSFQVYVAEISSACFFICLHVFGLCQLFGLGLGVEVGVEVGLRHLLLLERHLLLVGGTGVDVFLKLLSLLAAVLLLGVGFLRDCHRFLCMMTWGTPFISASIVMRVFGLAKGFVHYPLVVVLCTGSVVNLVRWLYRYLFDHRYDC